MTLELASPMQLSQEISAWAAGLRWDDIPAAAQHRAVDTLRDVISVSVAGAGTKSAQIAARYARASPGGLPLIAGGTSALATAAFANGVAASALDYDDGHYLAGAIHGSSPTISGALMAIDQDTTIREFLTAQVAGLEVALRAGSLLWMKHPEDWYHSAGCAGTIGAAVAGAHLRKLDADGVFRALVIAWQHAPISSVAFPMIKESIGWGASSGATAAALAAAGWLAMPDASYPHQPHIVPSQPFDRDGVRDLAFVTSFGVVFESTNTYFKTFAACRYTHAPAVGVQRLMRRHGLLADDIGSIEIRTFAGGVPLDEVEPATLEHAQYSLPHVIAAMVIDGHAGPRQIHESRVADRDRVAMARRVRVLHDPVLDAGYPAHYPAGVRIVMRDGRSFDEDVPDAPDDAEPVSAWELSAKWVDALTMRSSTESAVALLDELGDLDRSLGTVLAPWWGDSVVTANA